MHDDSPRGQDGVIFRILCHNHRLSQLNPVWRDTPSAHEPWVATGLGWTVLFLTSLAVCSRVDTSPRF